MADAQPQVSFPGWTADHVQAFGPSVAASPWGPFEGLGDVLTGANLVEVHHGRQHALMAVRQVQLQHGRRLDVVGLVSIGDRLDSAAVLGQVLPMVARQAEADQIAMCTVHPHLIRRCLAHGWAETGRVMTYRMPHVQQ